MGFDKTSCEQAMNCFKNETLAIEWLLDASNKGGKQTGAQKRKKKEQKFPPMMLTSASSKQSKSKPNDV